MDINHVFFHDDIDGIISAAIYMHYNKDVKCRLYPVTSTMRGEKFITFFNQILKGKTGKRVILDYQYHKDVDLWIDHHFNPDFGEAVISSEKFEYNTKSPSAARLVYKKYGSENKYNELIEDVDMIDSCGYSSVNQIFKDTNSIMLINAYLEVASPNDMSICRIVEMINSCDLDIYEAAYLLMINSYYVKELEKNANKIKNAIVISKKISIVNQKNTNQYPRYSEYLLYPEVKYAIRITNIGNGNLKIGIGYNKWHNEKNELNLGKICYPDVTKSWGGHFNIGSGVIHEDNLNSFVDMISKLLNDEVEEMEKYGVDQSDPVEQKATELVKTGEAKNVTDARKVVVENNIAKESEGIDVPGTNV